MCLKRYSMLPNGTALKRKTHIDIPLEIGLPQFISDDQMADDGPAFGNFKMSLQSVVCHQGVSVEAGHYVSLVRCPDPERQGEDRWLRFDDLAKERVTYTDVDDFLRKESPYLLFYQIVPIGGDVAQSRDEDVLLDGDHAPSYAESTPSSDSRKDNGTGEFSTSTKTSYESSMIPSQADRPSVEIRRPSLDTSISEESRRGRSSMTGERQQVTSSSDANRLTAPSTSIPLADRGQGSNSDPGVQLGGDGPNTLTASRRGSRTTPFHSGSRPSSQTGEKRLSASLSRIASKMSRDTTPAHAEVLAPSETVNNASIEQSNRTTAAAPPRRSEESGTKASAPVDVVDKASDRARLKKETREKSKNRQKEHSHLIKARVKEGKPDRDCSMM